jgi:hypothetical protein
MLTATKGMSQRLACKAVGLARSIYRRLPVAQTPADPDAEMRAWRYCGLFNYIDPEDRARQLLPLPRSMND